MKKVTKSAASKSTPAQPAPAPAKSVKKSAAVTPSESAPKAKAAKPAVKKAAKKPAPAPVDAALTSSTLPPVVKGVAAIPFATCITAKVDVGFGNALYIRGEGPGLSWETGVLMDCVADDRWSIRLEESGQPIVFKVLLNDLTWCAGDDFVAQPGADVVVSPTF